MTICSFIIIIQIKIYVYFFKILLYVLGKKLILNVKKFVKMITERKKMDH